MTNGVDREDAFSGAETTSVAASDINIENVVMIGAYYRDVFFDEAIGGARAPEGDTTVSLRVNMQVLIDQASRQRALVRLGITARPDGQPVWEANAEYVAVYSAGSNPPLTIEEFAWSNGIANLVPFIRERLASLTQSGNYATYILPPVSVSKLRELYEQQTEPSEG